MRVAVLTPEFPSVSQTFVMNQIVGIVDAGHDVQVFALRAAAAEARHEDIRRHDLLGRTTWFTLASNRTVRAISSLWTGCRLFISRPSATLRSAAVLARDRRPVAVQSTLRVAAPLIRKARHFDVLYCHFGEIGIIAHRLRRLGLLSGRLVTVFHGFDITRFVKERGREVYAELLAGGDLFLPVSERWKRRLLELGAAPAKIRVHRMGVDCARFTYKPRQLRPDETVRIVTVARLVEKKGIEYSIRAVAELLGRGHRIDYRIVGDGPLRAALRSVIDETGCGAHIRLLGPLAQREVIEVLGGAHLLMLTSVTDADGDQEGIPVSIMEAMAMGLPVISTWHSGIPELIADGVTGVLVPERDVQATASAVEELIATAGCWPEMGAAARARIRAEYDSRRLNGVLVETLREVCACR